MPSQAREIQIDIKLKPLIREPVYSVILQH